MIHDHCRNIFKGEPTSAGANSPILVFSDLNSRKWADLAKIRLTNGQITTAGKSVVLDVQFLSVTKNTLIRLDTCPLFCIVSLNLNVAAKNGTIGQRTKR